MVAKERYSRQAADVLTGKAFDNEEVDVKEEEWIYDESEMIWKRNPCEINMKRILSFTSSFAACFPKAADGYQLCIR